MFVSVRRESGRAPRSSNSMNFRGISVKRVGRCNGIHLQEQARHESRNEAIISEAVVCNSASGIFSLGVYSTPESGSPDEDRSNIMR
ncbi:hypothetical protein KCU92_g361, partial [Aureobasidium melanogenum]